MQSFSYSICATFPRLLPVTPGLWWICKSFYRDPDPNFHYDAQYDPIVRILNLIWQNTKFANREVVHFTEYGSLTN